MDYQTALRNALSQIGVTGGDEIDLLRSIPGINAGTETLSGFANQLNSNPSLAANLPSYYSPVLEYLNMGQPSTPQVLPMSPIPTQTRPEATTPIRPTTTRTGGTTSPTAMTRGQVPPLAVDPGISAMPASTGASTSPAFRRIMTSGTGTGGTGVAGTGAVANIAANPSIPATTNTTAVPTMGQSGQTGYDPQAWSNQSTGNPFINSSGGFAYDALPGMYNYLMNYLGENANLSSGVNNALTGYLGQNLTSDYPQQMSEYLQQLIGGLGSGQMQYGTDQQTNAANMLSALSGGQGTSTPIQQQVQNTLSQLIGGSGLSPEYVAAAQESILKPALENTYGTANNMAGGVGELSSGLAQELARRTQSDFSNQLVKTGYENLSNLLNQGNVAGATSYNQGLNLANLTGDMGQNAINNTLNSMSQGQNLMGTLLSSLLGLQGNAQNYTTALTGQYGNLAQGLLGNKTASEATSSAASANKASSIGNLLGSIASGIAGSGSGASGNLSKVGEWLKNLFGNNTSISNEDLTQLWNTIGESHPEWTDILTGQIDPSAYGDINPTFGGITDIGQEYPPGYGSLEEYLGALGSGNDISWINDLFGTGEDSFDFGQFTDYTGTTDMLDPAYASDIIEQQPSTYQWFYDLFGSDLYDSGDFSWLYGY